MKKAELLKSFEKRNKKKNENKQKQRHRGHHMFAKERQSKIEQLILERGSASVLRLSQMFNVSEVTIRKDLDELQKGNRVVRTHGGAVVKYQSRPDWCFQNLAVVCLEEKQQIARKALEFIEDGDSILMDGATTVRELAVLINSSELKNITIITNSIELAQTFDREAIEVILVGGSLNPKLNTVTGPIAERNISYINVDKCFIGISGIDEAFGFSTDEFSDAAIKLNICRSSKQSFVLADHTKFSKRYLAKVFDLDGEANYIITDKKCPGIEYAAIEKKIQIIFADS